MELGVILEGSDWTLSKKLRTEDPEQFYTLVRMHLSFVLDLTTEDSECPAEKDKLRQLLKWGLAPFMKRTRPITKSCSEGQPLTKQGLAQIKHLIKFLSKDENINQEGIFRRSGKLTRQQELKSLLTQDQSLNLDNGQFSVHDCASVFKGFLAELSEPLLTEAYYPAYCQIAELCISEKSSERLLRALQLLLLLLPEENWLMLKEVIMMLNLTASHEGQNKMSAENLATLFTPHLLCPRKLSPEALHSNAQMLSHVVIFMIRSGLELFQVPPTLATDIYAYWERKKLSSQVIEISESAAANTVFSFVDRERTAQENTTNPTEAALAQLYAYIQSLPESNKKRRLVKQFNKENGHGTPRQASSRACSFGDSIKKRIFSKCSKNPKPLFESNLLKSGRSSSEEILDSPEYLKCITPTKLQLKFDVNAEDADSSLSKSETSCDKLDEFTNYDKENIDNKSDNNCDNALVPSENNSETFQPLLPTSFSLCKPFLSKPINLNTSASSGTAVCSANVDHLFSLTPENKSFFTPPTPVSLKHRYWSIGKASCSTPNAKQCSSINGVLLTSTPACNNCLLSTSPMVTATDDMSPITRSTQRMTKAMQETMMTPRSRKPVVALSGSNICHLANMTWGVKDASWSGNEKTDGNCKQKQTVNSYEEDSLTSPFRDYLLSRSILTTSPVDLSFSSRTGDFDPSSFSDDVLPSSLNESLLQCMDGKCVSFSDVSESDSVGSRKRDGCALDDKMVSKRERSSSTSGHSTESSKEAVFETSL